MSPTERNRIPLPEMCEKVFNFLIAFKIKNVQSNDK